MDESRIPENNGELKGFDEEIKKEDGEDRVKSDAIECYTVTRDGGFYENEPIKADERVNDIKKDYIPNGSYGTQYTPPKQDNFPKPDVVLPPVKKDKEPKKYSLATIILAVFLVAVISSVTSVGILFALDYLDKSKDTDNEIIIGQGNEQINIDVKNVDATIVEAVAKKVTSSVVGIRVTVSMENFFGGTEESSGEGSGVIYTSDGYIITNYHVIENATVYSDAEVKVFLNDKNEDGYTAKIVGYNISNDLAVIKINAKNLPAISFADSKKLSVGQFVVAIGNPGGLDFMGSVTYGVISGLNRMISDTSDAASLIQTDAAINPGNSGGALVNINGELVGVNSSKIVSTGYEGMGFAIPSNTVKEITDKIISNEDDPTPYIGVTISEKYDAETLKSYGYPVGAVVYSVVSGGPADKAGIDRADIITEFNGVEITNYTVLNDAISKCKPGQTVSVTIYTARRYYSTNITIGANNEVN